MILASAVLGADLGAQSRSLSVAGAGRQPYRGQIVSIDAGQTGALVVTLDVKGVPSVLTLVGLAPSDLPLERCQLLEVSPRTQPDGPSMNLAFSDRDGHLVALVGINQRLGRPIVGAWSARSGTDASVELTSPDKRVLVAKVGQALSLEVDGVPWSMDLRQTRPPLVESGSPLGTGSDASPFRYSYVVVQRAATIDDVNI